MEDDKEEDKDEEEEDKEEEQQEDEDAEEFLFHVLSFITGFYSFYDSNLPSKDANFFMNLIRISNLSDRHGRQTDKQKDGQTDKPMVAY